MGEGRNISREEQYFETNMPVFCSSKCCFKVKIKKKKLKWVFFVRILYNPFKLVSFKVEKISHKKNLHLPNGENGNFFLSTFECNLQLCMTQLNVFFR